MTEYVKVFYTKEERAELALELARATQSASELELRKKQVSAAIKSEMEEQAAVIQTLARKVHDGYEFADVEVEVVYDKPIPGQKEIYRADTLELVKTTAMTDSDRQKVLDFEETR